MPSYNTLFELNLRDIELIEDALRTRKAGLSARRLDLISGRGTDPEAVDEIDAELLDMHALLGRLHNQKVFYRPRNAEAPYIGG
jgi:hypothetical protein